MTSSERPSPQTADNTALLTPLMEGTLKSDVHLESHQYFFVSLANQQPVWPLPVLRGAAQETAKAEDVSVHYSGMQ